MLIRSTAEVARDNLYVNYLLLSRDDREREQIVIKQIKEVLARGGFRLRKWISKDRSILGSIANTDRS